MIEEVSAPLRAIERLAAESKEMANTHRRLTGAVTKIASPI